MSLPITFRMISWVTCLPFRFVGRLADSLHALALSRFLLDDLLSLLVVRRLASLRSASATASTSRERFFTIGCRRWKGHPADATATTHTLSHDRLGTIT
jgi:hypothetical protein